MLPAEVRDLARRLSPAHAGESSVMLTQTGTMRDQPDDREMRFRAHQTIALRQPAFRWQASTGPFGCISIIDAFENGAATLQVRAVGLFRLANIKGGAAAAKGEAMRYLAELAWAPDAIRDNPHLEWSVSDAETFSVGLRLGAERVAVQMKLDARGRIASVSAPDRPRKEASGFIERPWFGRFFDYREHLGRWLPYSAEAGWVLDGHEFVAWRGNIRSWTIS